jgi:hypothetical protein
LGASRKLSAAAMAEQAKGGTEQRLAPEDRADECDCAQGGGMGAAGLRRTRPGRATARAMAEASNREKQQQLEQRWSSVARTIRSARRGS